MTVEFVAATENIADLLTLLKPLGSKVGNCVVSEDGLQFSIETDKILLVQTWVPASLFIEFSWVDLEFSIDIGLLLESLHVFAQEKILKIQCKDDLILSCERPGVSTRISLKKYVKASICNLTSVFGDYDILTKIIIKSKVLSTVLGDLDASCNFVTFSVSDTCFLMSCVGSFGETEIKFEKDSSVFDSFEYFGGNGFCSSYNFSLFKYCVKALAISKKTCIRIKHDGVLSLQFMIPLLNESKFSFIEFAITPAFSD